MNTREDRRSSEVIPKPLASVLAPIDRRALAVAVGTTSALGSFIITIVDLLRHPQPGINLELLGQFFPGYHVSWFGAVVGAIWAFIAGFTAGWLLAFIRNLSIAAWIFMVRSRYEISATRDFMDHI